MFTWEKKRRARWRTSVCLNLAMVFERADEVILPAAYSFVARSFAATPSDLANITLARALVQSCQLAPGRCPGWVSHSSAQQSPASTVMQLQMPLTLHIKRTWEGYLGVPPLCRASDCLGHKTPAIPVSEISQNAIWTCIKCERMRSLHGSWISCVMCYDDSRGSFASAACPQAAYPVRGHTW